MEKRQQWIVGAIAVLAAVAIGSVTYRQFVGSTESRGLVRNLREQAARERQATDMKNDGFDSGAFPIVPVGKESVDGVVAGIASDLDAEAETLDIQVAETKSALDNQGDAINDLDNAYEQDKF
ncbi:MAG: hypothetical protein HGA31_06380 [Candidatus Moranbacteria bacterium]|nr:hypothetical protein [Candidatus Moranbacteria bacterium]